MGRRAAIFLHAQDVNEVKTVASKNVVTAPSQKPVQKGPAKPARKPAPQIPDTRSWSTTPIDAQHEEAVKRRRASLSYQARRPSTLPEMSTAPPRRPSIRRGSTLPHTSYGTSGRRPSVKPGGKPGGAKPKPPPKAAEPTLTNQQVDAFKEVFDLFDSNGGGTIDAEELQQVLASVDIHLTETEINDVLLDIDKDGSGEIDFDEFLNMMTNTEKFLECFDKQTDSESDPSGGSEGRENILFDALTKFMRSSALKQMEEIVGFYKTQYKRVQAPHVVMHYAAGARLIGLTEKQLVQHMQLLQKSNRESNHQSPYAEPLRFILMGPPRPPRKQVKKKEPPPIPTEPRCTGKIKLKIRIVHHHDKNNTGEQKPAGEGDNGAVKKKLGRIPEKDSFLSVYKPRLGWVESKVKHIEHRLPTTTRLAYANDLPTIRKNIAVATRKYHHDVAESKHKDNVKYWKQLRPELIPKKQLQNNFRKVFNAYIPLDLKTKA